jgi:hypothetical protein
VVYLVLIFIAGFVLGSCAYFLSRRLGQYTVVTVYEVSDGMVPADRDLLLEIAHSYRQAARPWPNPCDSRRQLRLDLASMQIQFQRMLTNAARPRNWASSDRRIIKKNKLECHPDILTATDRVLESERELRRLILWVLLQIWLWSLSNFHAREWGPVPDICRLDIIKVLDLYEKVRLAAVNLARCHGEATVAEEIAVSM